MDFPAAAFYGQVDFALLCSPWPQSRAEQHGLLTGIGAAAWHRSSGPDVEDYVILNEYSRIAKVTRETQFGQRWFDIWRHPDGSQLLVVKEAAPAVVVCCDLTASPSNLCATFTLLSGRILGTLAWSAEGPLLVQDLRQAASEQALRQGLLETHRQVVGLALPGFEQDLPDGLLLWPSLVAPELGPQEWLKHWLRYLQTLSPVELRSMDILSPDLCMSDEDSTSGLEGSADAGFLEESESDMAEDP